MKTATTLLVAALIACTNAQTTDLSPPFNPDPEFTSNIPPGSGSINPIPTLTPDITTIDPDTVTGEITLTYFTESISTSGAFEPPILTGRPSGRPSSVPDNSDVLTPTTSVISTVINGTSISTTSTGIVSSTRSTTTGGPASTTTTGANPSVTNQPAAAPKINGGLMAVVGGVAAGVVAVAVAL